jgi:hypothetical protein
MRESVAQQRFRVGAAATRAERARVLLLDVEHRARRRGGAERLHDAIRMRCGFERVAVAADCAQQRRVVAERVRVFARIVAAGAAMRLDRLARQRGNRRVIATVERGVGLEFERLCEFESRRFPNRANARSQDRGRARPRVFHRGRARSARAARGRLRSRPVRQGRRARRFARLRASSVRPARACRAKRRRHRSRTAIARRWRIVRRVREHACARSTRSSARVSPPLAA